MHSLTDLNSSRVMTLFMSESNWLNRFRMATKPEDTRSSSLGLPSAVTCKQPCRCQGTVFSATVQGLRPTRALEAAFQDVEGARLCQATCNAEARQHVLEGMVARTHVAAKPWLEAARRSTSAWQGLQHRSGTVAMCIPRSAQLPGHTAGTDSHAKPGSLLPSVLSADLDGSEALAGCVGGCLNALHEDAHVGIAVCLAAIVKGPVQAGSSKIKEMLRQQPHVVAGCDIAWGLDPVSGARCHCYRGQRCSHNSSSRTVWTSGQLAKVACQAAGCHLRRPLATGATLSNATNEQHPK